MRPSDQPVYTCTLHAQWIGSLQDFQTRGGNKFIPAHTDCLLPTGLAAEDRARMFPNNECNLVSATLKVCNGSPAVLGFTLSNAGIDPTHTAGTSRRFNAIAQANGKWVSYPLIQKDTENSARLARMYPGYNAGNVRTKGVMTDLHDKEHVHLKTDHPAISILEQDFIDTIANALTPEDAHAASDSLDEFHRVIADSEHVKVKADVAHAAIEQAEKEFKSHVHLVNLKDLGTIEMHRADSNTFNNTNGLVVTPADNISAILDGNSIALKQTMATGAAAPDPAALLKISAEARHHALLAGAVSKQFCVQAQLEIVYVPSGTPARK
jgi:hypothetical protein